MVNERQIQSLVDQAEAMSQEYQSKPSPAARQELVRVCKLLAKEIFNLCAFREEVAWHNKVLIVDAMLDQIEVTETDWSGKFDEVKRDWLTTDADHNPSDWALHLFVQMVPKLPQIRPLLE